MKEHHRTDRLTIITILLVLVVGAILITYRAPELSFSTTPEEMLDLVQEKDYIIPISESQKLLEDENTVFVDIRNQGEFVIKKIRGAINIPLPKILSEEAITLFENEDKTFVLYGADHSDASGVWMLLRQLGFENVKVLLGGYDNFKTDSTAFPYFYDSIEMLTSAEFELKTEMDLKAKEIADADAAKVEEMKVTKLTTRPTVQKKVSKSAPVLPPPPAEEEEEEEGC